MDIVADGTVPSGGGLSSSGAFVCTSALSVMKANGEEIVDKRELTELAIVSERAVGVNSGGWVYNFTFPLRCFVEPKPSCCQEPSKIENATAEGGYG